MNRTMTAFLLGATLAVSMSDWAHTDEYFDSIEAPHGGQLRMAGPYHLELVAKDGEITLYVADHMDNKISTDGGEVKATFQTGETSTHVGLYPVGDNMLKASGDFPVMPDTVIIVFIKLPDQEAYAARFTPPKPKNTPVETN
jgi:hypothetical protein